MLIAGLLQMVSRLQPSCARRTDWWRVPRIGCFRAGVFALLAAILLPAASAVMAEAVQAQELYVSAETQALAEKAIALANDGSLQQALKLLDAGIESASPTEPLVGQQAYDFATVLWVSAGLARRGGELERAADHFAKAAMWLEGLGAQEAQAEMAHLRASEALLALDREKAAGEELARSRAIRERAGQMPNSTGLLSARVGVSLAIRSGIDESFAREMAFLNSLANQILTAPGSAAAYEVFFELARLSSGMGLYSLADTAAQLAAADSAAGLWIVGAPPEMQALKCNEVAELYRGLAGLRIEMGDLSGASSDLTKLEGLMGDEPPCGGRMDAQNSRYQDSLWAKLHLRAGQAVSARLRLMSFERQVDEDTADAEIAEARMAETRLSLGFIGEAESYYKDKPDDVPLFDEFQLERDRLMARVQLDVLSGRAKAGLELLDRVEALQVRNAPRDWYPLAEIRFKRMLMLLESGAVERATELRRAFEQDFEAYIAETREMQRKASDEQARASQSALAAAAGEKFAQQTLEMQLRGEFEPPAYRALDKMRMLFDLSLSVHSDDRQAAKKAYEKLSNVGLPSSTLFTEHSQRAYLLGCLMAEGPGMCDLAIKWASSYPYAPPMSCIPSCGWVADNASDLSLTSDIVRGGPLRNHFLEPVLAQLWELAEEARKEAAADLTAGGQTTAFSKIAGDFAMSIAGADLALNVAQQISEGGATTAVAQVGRRLASGSTQLAALLRQRDMLSEELGEMLRAGEPAAGHIGRVTAALREVQAELVEKHPEYIDSFDPSPVSRFEISELLPPGSAFLMIVTLKSASYSFAVRDDEFAWVRSDLGEQDLSDAVAQLRRGLDPDARNRGARPLVAAKSLRPEFDRTLSFRLYEELLKPLESLLAGEAITAVINGPLSALPLSVLVTQAPQGSDDDPDALRETAWLIRDHAIVRLATANGLRLAKLQRARARASKPFVGFGDALFTTPDVSNDAFARLPSLPGTHAEIKALAGILDADEDSVFLGTAATKEAILSSNLADARVVSFATHGLLAGQVEGLKEPGLVFSRVPGGSIDQSFLSASDAAALELNADWVLLSACNTAGSDGRPDSTGLSGLARAFIFAGARSVLVSQWPVRDDAAMRLTTAAIKLGQQNESVSKAEALRRSILLLMEDDSVADFARPSSWAPFILVGDG